MEEKTKVRNCILIEPVTCMEDESVIEVAKKLRGTLLRHLFVVDSEDKPLGLISMTDINNRVVAEGKNPGEVKASDIMSQPLDLVNLDDETEETAKRMLDSGRTINAVVENEKIVGIISLDQLIKKINE